MGFTLPKQNDEELPVGEDGHTRAPDHTRDRMGEFLSVAFWNWSQPSTDWFNLATGEALAEYNPSPVMRELVLGIESESADPQYLAQHALNAEKHATQRAFGFAQRAPTRETRTSTRQDTHSNARNTHVNSRLTISDARNTHVNARRRAPARASTHQLYCFNLELPTEPPSRTHAAPPIPKEHLRMVSTEPGAAHTKRKREPHIGQVNCAIAHKFIANPKRLC
jgi:hypothetical protein